jgi:thiol-disulfide isomerase/thioredoxin
MKKSIAAIIVAALLVLAACSGGETQENTISSNKDFSPDSMVNVSGEEQSLTDVSLFGSEALGMAFIVPDAWYEVPTERINQREDESALYIMYAPAATIEWASALDISSMSNDEITEAALRLESELVPLLRVSALESGEPESGYAARTEVGSALGKSYFIDYNTETPDTLTGEDAEYFAALAGSVGELEKTMMLFPPVTDSFGGSLESFTAEDMDGNEVTESIFADYDITMVNIWTTWCSYCIEEMPYLQELYTQLPENANLITVCGDALTEPDLAREILTDSGAEFTTIAANDEVESVFLNYVTGFPTTVFLDSKGKPVGETITGAPRGDVAAAYLEEIEARLALVGD